MGFAIRSVRNKIVPLENKAHQEPINSENDGTLIIGLSFNFFRLSVRRSSRVNTKKCTAYPKTYRLHNAFLQAYLVTRWFVRDWTTLLIAALKFPKRAIIETSFFKTSAIGSLQLFRENVVSENGMDTHMRTFNTF